MWLKIKLIAVGIVVLLSLTAAGVAWYKLNHLPTPPSKIEYVKVPQIKIVEKIKKVEVPGPEKIVTIEKQVIVEKLKMPEWAENHPNDQAIATAVVPPYEGKTNAVATIDVKTGIGSIFVKQEPIPLFAFLSEPEVGIRAGINSAAKQDVTIYGQWDFLRVGKIRLGLYGEADSTGNAKAQVQVGWRF